MYVSLYRRYRPQNFSDVVGQTAAVSVLQQSLNEKRIGHAYLFSGPRGCGKTSVARILAKALNCLSPKENSEPCCECANCSAIAAGEHLDVIEIDGASNRGINEIRDLKSRVNLKPLNAVYKIYIIDEVHMLTEQAFNALLKTLEEPPANVVFILATTEPNKVPVTIRSRCQHIPFHRISMSDLVSRIAFICEREGISAEAEAVWEIARQADGALRDALSITEQSVALGSGSLTVESLKGLLGGSSRTELEQLVTELRSEPENAAKRMREIFSRGVSVETFSEALFNIYRDLWLYSLWGERSFEAVEASEAEHAYLAREAKNWTSEQLKSACSFCNKLMPRAKYGMKTEIFSGLILLGLCKIQSDDAVAVRNTEADEKPETSVHEKSASDAMPVYKQKDAASVIQMPSVSETDEDPASAVISSVLENDRKAVKPAAEKMTSESEPAAFQVLDKVQHEEEQTQKKIPETAPFPFVSNTGETYDESGLPEKLGSISDVMAKLASALPSRKIEICAALLDAEIVKDGDLWKTEFTAGGKNAAFLKNAENAELLAKAVCDVFGFEPAIDKKTEITQTQKPAEVYVPAQEIPVPQKETQTRMSQHGDGSIDRMLKLMGADVLYAEDENSGGAEDNGE